MVKISRESIGVLPPQSPSGSRELAQFSDIIKGIGELMKQAKELKGPLNPPSNTTTTIQPQVDDTKTYILKLVTGLEAQGHGNLTILEVLGKLPVTISQVKQLLQSL